MPALPQRPALPPLPPPSAGLPRRSSGNTMEAAPQPRPGGAAAPLPPPPEQERKLEQEKLSGVVKSVHRRLRKKYREGNRGGGGRSLPSPREPGRQRGTARLEPPFRGGRRRVPSAGSPLGSGCPPGGGGARCPQPLPERGGPAGPRTAAGGGVPGGAAAGSSSGLASCLFPGGRGTVAVGFPQPRRGVPVGSAEVLPFSVGSWQGETPWWLRRAHGASLGALPVGCRRRGLVGTGDAAR